MPDLESLPPAVAGLDPGEQQALAIALAHPGAVVLVDDGAARRVARAERLPVIGTIGLIAAAKDAGLCPSAREKYALLLTTRFRIARSSCRDERAVALRAKWNDAYRTYYDWVARGRRT